LQNEHIARGAADFLSAPGSSPRTSGEHRIDYPTPVNLFPGDVEAKCQKPGPIGRSSVMNGTRQTKEGSGWSLTKGKLRAQRISKKSETAEEDAKMTRFQDLSDSESGYTSTWSKSPETVMMSKATVPQWYSQTSI
jgi:hypothetical protein